MTRSVVLVAIECRHPSDWNGYDLTDVVQFHLGLGDLTTSDIDVSAVDITGVRYIDREIHHG